LSGGASFDRAMIHIWIDAFRSPFVGNSIDCFFWRSDTHWRGHEECRPAHLPSISDCVSIGVDGLMRMCPFYESRFFSKIQQLNLTKIFSLILPFLPRPTVNRFPINVLVLFYPSKLKIFPHFYEWKNHCPSKGSFNTNVTLADCKINGIAC